MKLFYFSALVGNFQQLDNGAMMIDVVFWEERQLCVGWKLPDKFKEKKYAVDVFICFKFFFHFIVESSHIFQFSFRFSFFIICHNGILLRTNWSTRFRVGLHQSLVDRRVLVFHHFHYICNNNNYVLTITKIKIIYDILINTNFHFFSCSEISEFRLQISFSSCSQNLSAF